MTRIAPVRLMYNPKVLWFDARDLDLPVDAHVVVTTARGTEYGTIAEEVFEATPEQLSSLKTELKPVVRLGSEVDAAAAEEATQLSLAAMPVFRELAAEESAEMRPIAVEYLLTCDKAVFYFESENRIDFRELVRKLAGRLHVRVDMRQIGSRDEARMMGGLGHCGQELCCKRLGGEFCPVSIRMAKEQDLSLNPQKISGLCGKLMCCLRYEYEAYKDFHARSPKVGDLITTPDGEAKVVELDVPREILTLKMPDDKKVKIALADMVPNPEGGKPKEVDAAAWEETMAGVSFGGVYEAAYLTSKFTTESQLGTPKAVRRGGEKAPAKGGTAAAAASGKGQAGEKAEKAKRGKQKKDGAAASAGAAAKPAKAAKGAAAAAAAQATATTVHRRRRGEARQVDTGTSAASAAAAPAETPRPATNRPGQKSSGLARSRAAAEAQAAAPAAKPAKAKEGAKAAKAKATGAGAGNAAAEKAQKPAKQKGQGQGQAQQQAKGQGNGNGKAAKQQASAKQKASKPKDGAGSAAAAASAASAASAEPAAAKPRREPRRRVRVDTAE